MASNEDTNDTHTTNTINSAQVTNDTHTTNTINSAQVTNDTHTTNTTNSAEVTNDATNQSKTPKKKIVIEVDEDDPCLRKDEPEVVPTTKQIFIPGQDPRFQQQNQTIRCWVMYTDFYRCEHILGEGADACTWFKQVFTLMCPKYWIENFDNLRQANKLPWHKQKTQGNFPGHKYGD